ncbi:uncharacterized protein [Physcomitrium patens]|uniref:Uncharacterized protein n=1 Tax=Physcomitrium patens TaxID=3218 RepID=A0A2K1K7H8_PHYPA|nr:uncharacterized protein LOC112285283 [Physcomitrium patens]PNR49725.1 hypothetical protein PHYPA_011621 [Physcomitrium patens]|eukprot:XP_024381728.1 uncharacterized protein LOC112285283 [Physcomitrella patens]
MGYTQIPEQAQRGRNKAVIELDKSELTQTINVLQKVLVHVNTHTNTLPKFPSHPPSSIPDFLTARISAPSRQSSISPVTVITPSVAALQQRLGLDLGSGLGLGPVGTFSTESTRYNDNGSTPSSFSSSSSILTIPPIGPPLGTSRPGPIGRPSAISMQGPLPGLQSHFGQLGFRSGELGSGDLTSRSLDIGSLSLGQAGLPPVRVSTGQTVGINGGKNSLQGSYPVSGISDPGLGLDRQNDSVRNGAFQTQQSVVGSSSFGQGRPSTPGTPQGNRTPTSGTNQQPPIGTPFSQGRPGTPGTPQGSRTPTSGAHHQGPIGPFTRQQSGNQSRPETPNKTPAGQPRTPGVRRVTEAASSWKGRWTTAVTEHNRDAVNVMLYASELDGLVGEEVHTGWLISSSKRLLNLWECCGYSKASEPALQVMHSQTTEFTMESMDIDTNAKMLLSLSPHPRDSGFVIALHSLAGESFFKFKGSIRIPDTGILGLRKQAPTGLKLLHVVSLQPLGVVTPALKTSVAAALNGDVMVYDLSAAATAPTTAVAPKAHWKAHDTPISSLHRSSFAPALITGASDGSVKLWDLKTKPSAPARQLSHPSLKAITGLNMLDVNTVSTASVDSAIFLWDIRNTGTPVLQVIPDSKPVVQMAVSPKQEAVAVTTRQGLYCLELSGPGGVNSVLSPLTPLPPAGPCTDMKWNAKTKQIYCSGVDGAISVFEKVNH